MSEAQAPRDEGHPPPAGSPSPLGPGAEPAADKSKDPHVGAFFFNPPAELTDDTPTVISKLPPRPPAGEAIIAGSLRGRRLAHFELLEAIGVGGMAAVLRARDTQLDRLVALKILPPEMAADQENIRRFHQEARAAARLDHENIARVFFCGQDQNLHFIAFEFVEGQNLRTLLERRGRLAVTEAVHYMLQIATGLAHAAARGVVHRDIKPSNIIIAPTGRAKLVDMGLARSQDPLTGATPADKGLTQSGVTLGTFDYISPEQALEPRDADVRSDIYSLGCTFYHVLTGQPPVPEGTAARKLHHHQHVPPPDPRQLNPDIPDDVAAILARMMAKDPKERYQRPEHLVQHLLQVAQKLGAAAEVPDGMLFVDAPLPSQPRPRPVLLAVVAAAVLVGLILILGQVTRGPAPVAHSFRPPPEVREAFQTQGDKKDKAAPSVQPGPLVPDRGPRDPGQVVRYETESSASRVLAEWAYQNAGVDEQVVTIAHDLVIASDGVMAMSETPPGLVFKGRKVVVQAKDAARPPTIWFQAGSRHGTTAAVWTALTVEAERFELRGVRLVVQAGEGGIAPGGTATADGRLVGLLLRGVQDAVIEQCEFIQADLPALPRAEAETLRASSILVEAGSGSRPFPSGDSGPLPTVRLQQCCFLGAREKAAMPEPEQGPKEILVGAGRGAQDAITVTGKYAVQATQCAFGPHAALVAFQGSRSSTTSERASVALVSCTALLSEEAAVFRLDHWATCDLDVRHSLFSSPAADPPKAVTPPPGAVLIRQTGDCLLRYQGTDNRYHHLQAYLVRPPDRSLVTLADFHKALEDSAANTSGRDLYSSALSAGPWKLTDPLGQLELMAVVRDREKVRQLFLVDIQQRDLRWRNDEQHVVGVENGYWGPNHETPLPPLKAEPVVARKERVVDPTLKEAIDNRYPSLREAVAAARSGDTILIRAARLMLEDPVRLDNAIDLTIKAHPDHHPLVTLGPTREADPFVFRIRDTRTRFEGLEFRLQPKALTVAALVGDGSCAFKDCWFTLTSDDPNRLVPLSVVTVADLNMPPTSPSGAADPPRPPAVSFVECFARGEGDLVRSARPFKLEVENSLVALTGSLLSFGPEGIRDEAAAAPSGSVEVSLRHITTYLTGQLIRLRAVKDLKGLVPVRVQSASSCLFVAATGRALVILEGLDTNENKMQDVLTWKGDNNYYHNFNEMLVQKSIKEMGPPPYKQDRWTDFADDSEPRFTRGKWFVDPPSPEMSLVKVLPSSFRLIKMESDPTAPGVNIDALPRLGAEAGERED
jgi:hypothetical protein